MNLTIEILLGITALIGWFFYFIQRREAKKLLARYREAIRLLHEMTNAAEDALDLKKKWRNLALVYVVLFWVFWWKWWRKE